MSARRTARGRSAGPTPLVPGGDPVTIVHVAAEYYPFARSGGLAEAVANLAQFQARSGLRTIAFLPLYRTAREKAGTLEPLGDPFTVTVGNRQETVRILLQRDPPSGTRLLFVEHDGFFDRPRLYGDQRGDYPDNHFRYALFTRAVLQALPLVASGTVVLHAHDWHAALALTYLRTELSFDPRYAGIATVLSVHNAGYQGHYPPETMVELGLPWSLFNHHQLEWYGQLNLLKAGLVFADAVVTVSPNHAAELRTAAGGFGLHDVFLALGDRFSGILNGIDDEQWNPETDRHIASRYSPDDLAGKVACKTALQRRFGLTEDPRYPVFGMAARLVTQKGLDLIIGGYDLFELEAQFVFIGSGEPRFESALRRIAELLPDRVAVDTHFTDQLEHQLMGGADFLLMPCQYEPCGLTQMRAQRYGVVPIVRRVGGLVDTVEDGVTGFVFDPYDTPPLVGAALRGLDTYHNPQEWTRMIRAAMARDFSWERVVDSYLATYRRALAQGTARR